MKDLTLKFADRADFSAFMESIGYYDDESMQDDIRVKEDGYFVNVRIINDSQISSLFDEYVVAVEHQLRGWM
ncbi:hypothetical protein [Escherichia coli]|uniref:hypothetical protein n=1 Tax=Escherichia coli TaxID=562 RepID=UPI001F4A9247|nr:hypothetical protein [Escherichia coli]